VLSAFSNAGKLHAVLIALCLVEVEAQLAEPLHGPQPKLGRRPRGSLHAATAAASASATRAQHLLVVAALQFVDSGI
jgi:hypothetical protein